MVAYVAGAGAMLLGAPMLVGTLILGHMRPMWMEVAYALPAAIVGLLLGAGLGLALEFGSVEPPRKSP